MLMSAEAAAERFRVAPTTARRRAKAAWEEGDTGENGVVRLGRYWYAKSRWWELELVELNPPRQGHSRMSHLQFQVDHLLLAEPTGQ